MAFLARGQRIVREATEAASEIAERRGALVGPLRISAPVSFGTLHLGSALYPFLGENPGIELTLDLEDRFVDAAADGYDAVIRHGPIRDDRLINRRLASSRRLLVASPAYLAASGTPRSLPSSRRHRAILYANRSTDWRFDAAGGTDCRAPQSRPAGQQWHDDARCRACRAGVGAAADLPRLPGTAERRAAQRRHRARGRGCRVVPRLSQGSQRFRQDPRLTRALGLPSEIRRTGKRALMRPRSANRRQASRSLDKSSVRVPGDG